MVRLAPSSPSSPPLDVRPFRASDVEGLAGVLPIAIDGSPSCAVELVEPSRQDPRAALVAEAGGEQVGALVGTIFDAGYRILGVYAREGALARVLPAFLRFLLACFPGQHLEARIGDAPADLSLRAELARMGAAVLLDQVLYRRDLRGFDAAVENPFTYRAYAETGKAHMVDALGHVFAGRGASGRPTADPVAELDRMIFECSGGGTGMALWRTAYLDGALAGVVLGACDDGEPPTGSLLYFGLVPELRGRGLGRVLHAAALRSLAGAGAARYEDATGVENRAMRAIFEANGCAPAGSVRLYRLHAPRESGRLTDFEALVAYLEGEGYAIEILEEGQWLRVPMPFGEHAALVEVGWLRDARLVQALHILPYGVMEPQFDRVARAVSALNASLNVPGFILDEAAQALSFRLALHMDERASVDIYHVRRVLASVVHTVAVHDDWWRELLGSAGPSYADPLLDAAPMQQTGPRITR